MALFINKLFKDMCSNQHCTSIEYIYERGGGGGGGNHIHPCDRPNTSGEEEGVGQINTSGRRGKG